MPNMDGTGPRGNGAGRGKGPCGRGLRRGMEYGQNISIDKEAQKKLLESRLKDLDTEKKDIENRMNALN